MSVSKSLNLPGNSSSRQFISHLCKHQVAHVDTQYDLTLSAWKEKKMYKSYFPYN